jgi:hypothetical protein
MTRFFREIPGRVSKFQKDHRQRRPDNTKHILIQRPGYVLTYIKPRASRETQQTPSHHQLAKRTGLKHRASVFTGHIREFSLSQPASIIQDKQPGSHMINKLAARRMLLTDGSPCRRKYRIPRGD